PLAAHAAITRTNICYTDDSIAQGHPSRKSHTLFSSKPYTATKVAEQEYTIGLKRHTGQCEAGVTGRSASLGFVFSLPEEPLLCVRWGSALRSYLELLIARKYPT